MTDSLEARRAALVGEARQRIIEEASGDWYEGYSQAQRDLLGEHEEGCNARLFHYHPMHDGDHGVRVTDCICPALRAAFARGVESRQGAGGVGELVRIVDRHLHKSADIACAGSGDVGSPDYCDVCHYWAPMFADLKAAVALRSAPPVQGPDAEAIAAVVDVEAALDEWLTLYYTQAHIDRWKGDRTMVEEFAYADLLDLLRTVTTPSEPLTLEQLEALPLRSVVLDDFGDAWQAFIVDGGLVNWCFDGIHMSASALLNDSGPLRLLHTGTATTRED